MKRHHELDINGRTVAGRKMASAPVIGNRDVTEVG